LVFFTKCVRIIGYEQRLDRRSLLRIGLFLGIGAGLGALSYEYLVGEKVTGEQEKAAKILNSVKEGQFYSEVTVLEVRDDDGQVLPVKVRSKPYTDFDASDTRVGAEIDEFNSRTTIEKAIPVWGEDPFRPKDLRAKAVWLAFFLPGENKRVGFSLASLFDLGDAAPLIEPYDIGYNPR